MSIRFVPISDTQAFNVLLDQIFGQTSTAPLDTNSDFHITTDDEKNFREVRLDDGGVAQIYSVTPTVVLLTRNGAIWPVERDGKTLAPDNPSATGFVDAEPVNDEDDKEETLTSGWVNVYRRPDGTYKIGKPLDSERRALRMKIKGMERVVTYHVR